MKKSNDVAHHQSTEVLQAFSRAWRGNQGDWVIQASELIPHLKTWFRKRLETIESVQFKHNQGPLVTISFDHNTWRDLSNQIALDYRDRDWSREHIRGIKLFVNEKANSLDMARALMTNIQFIASSCVPDVARAVYDQYTENTNPGVIKLGSLTITTYDWQSIINAYYNFKRKGYVKTEALGIYSSVNPDYKQHETNREFLREWIKENCDCGENEEQHVLENFAWFARLDRVRTVDAPQSLVRSYHDAYDAIYQEYYSTSDPLRAYMLKINN